MGKALGAFFRFVFALLVLGIVGYNTFEVARLRAEVEHLKAGERTAQKPQPRPAAGTTDPGTLALLTQAREHAERAQTYIKQHRYAEAQREAALATDAAKRASADAQANSEGAVDRLRDAATSLSSLSQKAGALFNDQKAGGGESAPTPPPPPANEKSESGTKSK